MYHLGLSHVLQTAAVKMALTHRQFILDSSVIYEDFLDLMWIFFYTVKMLFLYINHNSSFTFTNMLKQC